MASERLREIERLFHEARERPPAERDAWLAHACAHDPTLRHEVGSLLAQPPAGLIDMPFGALVDGLAAPPAPRLAPGSSVGPYRIERLLDVGGMGEVYRARDSRLDRDVAIKILPEAFAADAARVARFRREAKVLASLNHPHIATIYGLEDAAGGTALVMELVEGPTLADRIAAGALPLEDALPIARQIAQALEAAHEQRIVHRDLKPANIKVRADGTVKVLDFGLAKAFDPAGEPDAAATTPTNVQATQAGVILGTAAYMAPEQARGRVVDTRADIWAFGCVLYEMLTGRKAFPGETISDVIASILEREPEWPALPATTPPSIRRVLTRCLAKDAKRRLQHIGDVRIELEEVADSERAVDPIVTEKESRGAAPAVSSDRRGRPWAGRPLLLAVPLIGLVVIALAWTLWPRSPASLPAAHVASLTAYPGSERFPSLSPDGKQVAFQWNGAKGDNEDIYVQQVGAEQPQRLTTDPAPDFSPAWSPDGSQIAFLRREASRDALYLVPQRGGPARKVGDFSPSSNEGIFMNPLLSWSPDGAWLAVAGARSDVDNGIVLIAVDGSTRRVLLRPTGPGPSHHYESPAFSPTGDALAFAVCDSDTGFQCRVSVVGLAAALVVAGQPRRLSTNFEVVAGIAWTEDGASLIYGAASVWLNTFHLWRVPVSGKRAPERVDLAGMAAYPSISKAAHRLVFSRRSFDLNVWQMEEGRQPESVVSSTLADYDAYLSSDGKRIAFVTDRRESGSEVWTANRDGTDALSLTKGAQRTLGSPRWSRNGRLLAFDGRGEDGNWHLFVIDAAGGSPRALPSGPFNDSRPSWSGDGMSIYFDSDRSGRSEVWRIPATGGDAHQVTHNEGMAPLDSPDGKTLFFIRLAENQSAVFAMPAAGGPEHKILDAINAWQYAPAETGIYYVPASQQGQPPGDYSVRFLDYATGKSRTVGTIHAEYFGNGLSVSPDGKVLVNGVASVGADLMMIDSFR